MLIIYSIFTMNLDQKGNTIVATNSENSTSYFHEQITSEFHNFKNHNVIVDLSSDSNLTIADVKLFTDLINSHKEQKKSFVLVSSILNFNAIPNNIVLVPTIIEAHDIIEMDEIERDLGF